MWQWNGSIKRLPKQIFEIMMIGSLFGALLFQISLKSSYGGLSKSVWRLQNITIGKLNKWTLYVNHVAWMKSLSFTCLHTEMTKQVRLFSPFALWSDSFSASNFKECWFKFRTQFQNARYFSELLCFLCWRI